jgi:hypothetical protein
MDDKILNPSPPIHLTTVAPDLDRAALVADTLTTAVTEIIEIFGPDLAGFSIVVWDMRASPASYVSADHGMVSEAFVPTFSHDVLNRHLTASLLDPLNHTFGIDDPDDTTPAS